MKICDKNIFQIMLDEVLKSCKIIMISADIKADTKQEIKELVAASLQKYLLKTWNTMQNRLVFLISSWSVFLPVWFCLLRTGGLRVFDDHYLISMMKVICWESLNGWLLSLEFKASLQKFIRFPDMYKFHVIPGYNFSWYTE